MPIGVASGNILHLKHGLARLLLILHCLVAAAGTNLFQGFGGARRVGSYVGFNSLATRPALTERKQASRDESRLAWHSIQALRGLLRLGLVGHLGTSEEPVEGQNIGVVVVAQLES